MSAMQQLLENLSYVVTIIGLPTAIFVFYLEQRKERLNEEDEVYQMLSDNYQDFLKTVLDNNDLHLISGTGNKNLTSDQKERMHVIFAMLIALFERAYLLLYNTKHSNVQKRRWASWDDYMTEWCNREDFNNLLPVLLKGEDPEFCEYIMSVRNKIIPDDPGTNRN